MKSKHSLKIAIANANLGLAMASLVKDIDLKSPPIGHVDPVRKRVRTSGTQGGSAASRLLERQRRKNLATQIAKKSLKKS